MCIKGLYPKNFWTSQDTFPDRTLSKTIDKIYSHNLKDLLQVSRLQSILEDGIRANAALGGNWRLVKDWSTEKRYGVGIREKDAKELYTAITEEQGILPWLKTHW